jgi:DNA-binding PadR family transcriptional regulator
MHRYHPDPQDPRVRALREHFAGDRAAFGPWGPPFGGPGHHGHGHGHGPGPGPFPGRRGRGRGARRGNVRAAILALLAERPMHGYEMIQELQTRTGGVWRPSPGSVYPTLQLLEDEGLISSEEADGRRRFTLTDSGRAEADRLATPQKPWEEVTEGAGPTVMRVGTAAAQVRDAVVQIFRSGTEAQQAKAIEVLADTRRRLYAILAEDGDEPESMTDTDLGEA